MKKILLASMAFIVCALTVVSSAAAQTSVNIQLLKEPKTLAAALDRAELNPSVNAKAIRDFKKNFPGVVTGDWHEISNGWQVAFTENDARNVVVYDQQGERRYNISYYSEKKLPVDIRALVKSTYYDYSISGVEEVHVNDKVVYIVHMQDEATWKKLSVCDGEMKILEDFNKN